MNKTAKEKYSAILGKMLESDQKMREGFRRGKVKWNEKIDKVNSDNIKAIISEIGWPSAKKIGAENERSAWLIIQHSPDEAFQKKCLALMKKESANEKFIAYLEDRLRVFDNKKQLYGTQFYFDSDGKLVPRPIYNIKELEFRRMKVGLGSFKKYSEKIVKSFKNHSLCGNKS